MRITWLRRAGGQRHRTPGSRQAARERSRRTYRPYAERLEDRAVLSTALLVPAGTLSAPSLAALTGTVSPAKSITHAITSPQSGGSTAPTAAQRLADLTALLFAAEAPDLPAFHLPSATIPFNAFVPGPKIGVYPVPPATRPAWTGPDGGIFPEALRPSNGDSYQVFFPPSTLLQATAGALFDGAVVTVTVPDGSKAAARYQATIDWGDDTTATTGVIHLTGKHVGVEGQHTYTHQGHFAVQVHIEVDGTLLGNVAGTATVAPAAPLEPPISDKPVPETDLGPMSMRSTDPDKWSTAVLAAASFAFAPQAARPTRPYPLSRRFASHG